jgi:hypothetical protein
VRPKHVLIGFKKWMCYIDGQKNKYLVLKECSRMLKYNILFLCFCYSFLLDTKGTSGPSVAGRIK